MLWITLQHIHVFCFQPYTSFLKHWMISPYCERNAVAAPFILSAYPSYLHIESESVSSDRKTGMWNVESTFSPSPFTESKWVSTHYKTCVRLKAENTQFPCRAIYSLFTTSAGFSLAAIFMLNRFIHRRQQLILLSNWILPLKPFI